MNPWISLVDYILEKAPSTKDIFGKEWLYQEAKAAHPDSTAPLGALTVAAMLLEMAKRKDDLALIHADRVFLEAKKANAMRLVDLKNEAALAEGAAWQALAELSLYHELRSDGADVAYDQTSDVRTPDFKRNILKEDVGIEHVAPGEGQHMKQTSGAAEESLNRARRVCEILDHAKSLYESSGGHLPPFTENELTDLALSHGKEMERGKSPPRLTDDELRRAIEMHEIEEIRSFSAMPYVAARANSRSKDVQYLRQVKEGGEQVKDCKWKVLAISLPDVLYSWKELNETNRFEHPGDPDLVRIWSGVVWHAMFGTIGKWMYGGEYEHLVEMGVRKLASPCDGDGLLVSTSEPWHAVIVSIFSSTRHRFKSPSGVREGGDILPFNLSPSRALFLRSQGETLPQNVVNALCDLLSIKAVIRSK